MMKLKFAILWLTFFQVSLAQHTISGTLYASDVSNFVVIGCLIDIATQDCDYEKSQLTEVNADGSYTLNNLESGQHLVIVWRDSNGNGELEDTIDEIGYYTDAAGAPALVMPSASNINITLQGATNPLNNNQTNPLTTGTTNPPAQGSIVGSWYWGTVSSTGYYNETTGIWADPSGGGIQYIFHPDGTYEFNFLLQTTFYSCSTRYFRFSRGNYTLNDDILTLTPTVDKTKSEGDCNPSSNYEKDIALETKYLFVQFGRDISEFTGDDLGEKLELTDLVVNGAGLLEPDPGDPAPTVFKRETP
jgi:hypothetical protein